MSSSSSREYSPDWLRSQQPAASIWTLSSSSESASDKEKDDDQLPIITTQKLNSKGREPQTWKLPSDSNVDGDVVEEETCKKKSLQPNVTEQEIDDLKPDDKQSGPYTSSSTLPLLLSDKVQRSKVLVESEGESIDLSGDLGSVGRLIISDAPSGNQDMLLDLKGTIYKTTIMPSRTLCVVSFGQSEAKIEAIMNDFIQLKPQSNVYEAETMVEGTLEGFSFDSEDEGDKHASRQMDENEGAEPQTNGKTRGKSEAAKKKGRTAVKKPAAKKVNKKKAPVAKKTKAKK